MNKFHLNKNCAIADILNYGFKKNGTDYKMSVPLYTYKNHVVIYGIFNIDYIDHYMRLEVIDSSENLYSAYYDTEYSDVKKNKVLKTVLKKINNYIEDMQFKHILIGGSIDEENC